MGIQSEQALEQLYELIEKGQPEQAKSVLEEALRADLDNDDLSNAIAFCEFWKEVFPVLEQLQPLERGDLLLSDWKRFLLLVDTLENVSEKVVYPFRKGIYTQALECYKLASDEKDTKLCSEIYRKKGLCYKRLGRYEDALQCLTDANTTYQGQASVLAEMADCYDLCGETKLAKVLFKEAFFIDAQKIDLSNLDSPLIQDLAKRVQDDGYKGLVMQEWIPVYGILLGVLNQKRPLKASELGRLKQDIYAKENELKDPSNDSKIIVPRLLNMYLWLMDYYLLSKESVNKINEILLKIKILDPAIYKKYFSFEDGAGNA